MRRRFDFVVTPLSLLSGTFSSVKQLTPSFQTIGHANPFFYVISGFRAGSWEWANPRSGLELWQRSCSMSCCRRFARFPEKRLKIKA